MQIAPPASFLITCRPQHLEKLEPQWGQQLWDDITALSSVRPINANYFAAKIDTWLLVDATNGAVTVTLPDVNRLSGKPCTVKKTDASANTVTIVPQLTGQTIDGAPSQTLNAQWDYFNMVSDGKNWFIV